MMIVSDSDVELTSGFQLRARHGRAVTGHELATSASAMRATERWSFVFSLHLFGTPCILMACRGQRHPKFVNECNEVPKFVNKCNEVPT